MLCLVSVGGVIFLVCFGLFVDRVVGKVHESLLQTVFGCRVRNGGQPNETLLEHVNRQRLKRSHEHINPQIVFVTTNQMWLAQVLRHDVTVSFSDLSPLAHYFDAAATRAR